MHQIYLYNNASSNFKNIKIYSNCKVKIISNCNFFSPENSSKVSDTIPTHPHLGASILSGPPSSVGTPEYSDGKQVPVRTIHKLKPST